MQSSDKALRQLDLRVMNNSAGGLHIARFLGQKGVKANGEKGMLMFDDFIATAIGLGGRRRAWKQMRQAVKARMVVVRGQQLFGIQGGAT
jgi:hypothetical protein